jgi:UDP-N-acetylmuramate dehydrogenase
LNYFEETNTVVAGCSVKIQTLINFLADNNLGGIEYLFSLPASTGGCVCMNAGRAKEHNLSISDYVTSVEYFDGEALKKIEKDKCEFSHRTSVFQKPGKIITKVFFTFPYQEKEITRRKVKERTDYVKIYQEPQKPSLGTIFSSVDKRIIRKVKGLRIGDAAYSKKTQNWISNLGNAKYRHVITLINIVKLISFFMRKKVKLEIKIWA